MPNPYTEAFKVLAEDGLRELVGVPKATPPTLAGPTTMTDYDSGNAYNVRAGSYAPSHFADITRQNQELRQQNQQAKQNALSATNSIMQDAADGLFGDLAPSWEEAQVLGTLLTDARLVNNPTAQAQLIEQSGIDPERFREIFKIVPSIERAKLQGQVEGAKKEAETAASPTASTEAADYTSTPYKGDDGQNYAWDASKGAFINTQTKEQKPEGVTVYEVGGLDPAQKGLGDYYKGVGKGSSKYGEKIASDAQAGVEAVGSANAAIGIVEQFPQILDFRQKQDIDPNDPTWKKSIEAIDNFIVGTGEAFVDLLDGKIGIGEWRARVDLHDAILKGILTRDEFDAYQNLKQHIAELHVQARERLRGQGQVTEKEAQKVYDTIGDLGAHQSSTALTENLNFVKFIGQMDQERNVMWEEYVDAQLAEGKVPFSNKFQTIWNEYATEKYQEYNAGLKARLARDKVSTDTVGTRSTEDAAGAAAATKKIEEDAAAANAPAPAGPIDTVIKTGSDLTNTLGGIVGIGGVQP